ncbi:MAG TPA: hypothetical protein VJL84_08455 [Kiloniellales bacterium]|nr:hypothetical protein [Kiloniellales bacterium]
MASLRPLAAIFLLVALAGCALSKPTPYAPVSGKSDYGYSDTKIDDRTWRVSVNGNSQTPRELVENQLLYRAAEIAQANGATGFVVLDRETERDSRVIGGGYWDPFFAYPYGPFWAGHPFYPYYGSGFAFGYGMGFGGWSAGVGRTYGYGPYWGGRTVTKYAAYAEIQLFGGEAPTGVGPTFNAEQVLTNLAGKVNKAPVGTN